MIRQISPNKWSCLLVSFAQILDVDFKELINYIGHNGSELLFPDDPRGDPYTRRSFNVQEIIDYVLNETLYSVTEICEPVISCNGLNIHERPMDVQRLRNYMTIFDGVLLGTAQTGNPHAISIYQGIGYDTNGMCYSKLDWFDPHTYYVVQYFS